MEYYKKGNFYMAYFLRIHTRKRGKYLQIDESFRNKEKKRTDHKSFKCLGYLDDIKASGIEDPISYYKDYVRKLNEDKSLTKIAKISDKPVIYNIVKFIYFKIAPKFYGVLLRKTGLLY